MTTESQDRGDLLPDTTEADAAAAAAVATKAAEEAAAAAEATDATKTGDDEAAAAQARDEKTGKFTKKDDNTGPMVPKARFDEAVNKERERAERAERQLAEQLASKAQDETAAKIATMEGEVKELRIELRKAEADGNDEKVLELQGKIDATNRKIVIAETTQVSTKSNEQTREGIRVEMAIETVSEAYPELREGDPAFDGRLVEAVLAEQARLIDEERMSPSKALLKAAKDTMAEFTAKVAEAAAAKDPKKGLDAAAKEAADRAEAQRKKNLEAAAKQPASMKDAGIDSDKAGSKKEVEVNKMTNEEFAALPEATKAALRGDFVE